MKDTSGADGRYAGREVMGWREWLALPDLSIKSIKAKIDTGARTSALHAFDVEVFRRGGRERVRFKVHPKQRDSVRTVVADVLLLDERVVRSSSGRAERRPVVLLHAKWKDHVWPIEVTLTRRDVMGFRMLLGRQAIRGRFLVDPGRSYAGGRPPRKKKASKKARAKS
ncbi:MAG: RimK/LysX family protein [Acidobacteriota bacterium]|nr:RimK/LysX family protein [Acidobacteriota bacterium]